MWRALLGLKESSQVGGGREARGKSGGKQRKSIRARAVAVPSLTVACPELLLREGRRDVQVGVGPDECPRFHSPHSRLLPSPYSPPALAAGRAARW